MQGGPINTSAIFRHTTDLPNGQSVLERGDLDELMAMVSVGAGGKGEGAAAAAALWKPV